MNYKPIIIFDTSAINRLAKDPTSGELIAMLQATFYIRTTLIALQEMFATSCVDDRATFHALTKELLNSGDCIHALGELLKQHTEAFENERYNWINIDIRADWCLKEILDRESFPDDFSSELRDDGKVGNDKFRNLFKQMRSKFEAISKYSDESVEEHYSDFLSFLSFKFRPGGTYWVLAENIYKKAANGKSPGMEKVRNFVRACPPFHAYLLAIAYAEYQRCITSKPDIRTCKLPGLADTMMASYLPYCDQFITNDEGQYLCFKAVGSELDLAAQVVKYDDFWNAIHPEH